MRCRLNHTLTDILSLSGEPALLVSRGTIVFVNAGARRILGDCSGRKAGELLGAELDRTPARAYLLDTELDGVNYILRVNRVEEGRLVFLNRQEEAPVILNDAFLYTLRSNLMTLGVAADKLRPNAEQIGERGMLEDLTALTSAYYKLMRLSDNASLVRDLFEHRASAVPVELDMKLLCHAVLDAAEDCFPTVHFVRDFPEELRLNADPRLVRQLLFNLISNCLIHSGADWIHIRLSETAESVVLGVSDNGCGIPAEELSTVFDRYRCVFDTGGLAGGVGLGLTAARGIARLHGGTLLLESRTDQGTAIRASLRKGLPPSRFKEEVELCSMRDVLLGLADCLPPRCFEEKYLD